MTRMNIQSAYGEDRHETKANPLGIFISLIKEKPKAGEEAHKAALKRLLQSDGYEADLGKVIDEWMSIKYTTALQAAIPPSPAEVKSRAEAIRKDRERAASERAEQAQSLADQVRQVVLLDLAMPNGKPLRECTGSECKKLGPKMGAWLTKIGEAVKPRQIVGDALSEEEVRNLYGA